MKNNILLRTINLFILLGLIAPTAVFSQESLSKRTIERIKHIATPAYAKAAQTSRKATSGIVAGKEAVLNAIKKHFDKERPKQITRQEWEKEVAHKASQNTKSAVARVMAVLNSGKNATKKQCNKEYKLVVAGVKAAQKYLTGKPLTQEEKKNLRGLEIRVGVGLVALLIIIIGGGSLTWYFNKRKTEEKRRK